MDIQNRPDGMAFFRSELFASKKIVPILAGVVSALVGLIVIGGWYTSNLTLIQIQPHLVGMPYNTALCFVASGIALWAICKNYQALPTLLGVFVYAVGSLTLVQYLFNINFGFDQLLHKEYLTTTAPAPDRMAPNTALMFSLVGISLVILSLHSFAKKNIRLLLFMSLLVSSTILTLTLVAIFGYLSDIPGTYGWGNHTQIAIHSACTMSLLSCGLLILTWIKAYEMKISFAHWLPWFIFLMVEVLTLVFWQASRAYIDKNILQQTESAATSIKNFLMEELEFHKEGMLRMASRWKTSHYELTYEEWAQDALKHIAHQPGYETIQWVDPIFHVRWVAPLRGNEGVLSYNHTQEAPDPQALFTAMKDNTAIISSIHTIRTGDRGFNIYAPIEKDKKLQGLIVGVVNTKVFFDHIFHKFIMDYNVAISANGQFFYQFSTAEKDSPSQKNSTISLSDLGWGITVWPTAKLLKKDESWFPTIILFAGLFVALLLSVISYLAQTARKNVLIAHQEIEKRKDAEQKLIHYSEKLKRLSFIDSLTGINNRRALATVLKKELTQLRDEKSSLSILMLDIDHFKNVNDTYGHVIGDQVLQKIGTILRANMRERDTVARYGGEEFCVILPNTLKDQAYAIAERLRTQIGQQIFYCENNESFQLMCSIGVHQVTSHTHKINDIFDAVDSVLYKAKNAGRNCVVLE